MHGCKWVRACVFVREARALDCDSFRIHVGVCVWVGSVVVRVRVQVCVMCVFVICACVWCSSVFIHKCFYTRTCTHTHVYTHMGWRGDGCSQRYITYMYQVI